MRKRAEAISFLIEMRLLLLYTPEGLLPCAAQSEGPHEAQLWASPGVPSSSPTPVTSPKDCH